MCMCMEYDGDYSSLKLLYVSSWAPYKARGQSGVSGSYMHAVFKLKSARSVRDLDKFTTYFY